MSIAGATWGVGDVIGTPGESTETLAYPWAMASGLWKVVHTKSRQEKVLADELTAAGIVHYLPLVEQARYYGRRKAKVSLPLFAGYLFLKGSNEDAYIADRTRRVAKIIPVPHQQQLEWELRNIWLALSRNGLLDLYPYLNVGEKVEVRSGPFRGLQGLIERRIGNTSRLVLQITMLGRAVCLEIDGALLDPI
ncbi:MAG TPA: transcription termination/antitermination NusG family protein [Tepidisphaeraceae bacterium]|nr:transcription termination/antitermination NusG family protein [Tepidisphaeraceae bacterium]